MNLETTILYRPVGPKELELIRAGGFRKFPLSVSASLYFLSGSAREIFRRIKSVEKAVQETLTLEGE